MELWIRSQDRLTLKKVKEVYIAVRDVYQIRADYIPDLYENSGDCYTLLGEYQTKERAIEILDEIQQIINPHIIFSNCDLTDEMVKNAFKIANQKIRTEEFDNYVYQMPKEEK